MTPGLPAQCVAEQMLAKYRDAVAHWEIRAVEEPATAA